MTEKQPTYDNRELAAILAGLRLLQIYRHSHAVRLSVDKADRFWLDDIVENGGTLDALTNTEIDDLCYRLNTGEFYSRPADEHLAQLRCYYPGCNWQGAGAEAGWDSQYYEWTCPGCGSGSDHLELENPDEYPPPGADDE